MREFLRSPLARVWVPVLACAAVVAYVGRGTDPGDLVYFVHRGEHLLSGGWASTFDDPMLQSGPLQLAVFGTVRNLTALAFLIELGVAALLLYVAGRVGASDRIRLVIGLLAVGAGLTPSSMGTRPKRSSRCSGSSRASGRERTKPFGPAR